ncbi:MAG TPA: DUF4439 domain-containing protein [Jatrophihabitans sp.]|uniref:DUF4439 domain-containing protein n=1 Tax=Jatrophihabitans sp. TaxID=1932789 RepID=UPI002E053600|nr:DUF4439 domain-containing protein [Jatrophihabitans sp.]
MTGPSAAVVAAWQAALSAEQQAVFGYALLGPILAAKDRGRAETATGDHEATRDATSAALLAAGHSPVPPAADYPALYPVPDAAAARRLAVRLEDSCAAAWRYLYERAAAAPAGNALRGVAQDALTASAVRAAQWRALIDPSRATTPFPGI